MTENTNPENLEISLEIENDTLDDFNDLFLGKTKPVETEDEKEVVEKTEDGAESLEAQEEIEDKVEEKEEEEPSTDKKPKSRFQERISELTNAKKAEAARADRLEAELLALKAATNKEEPKDDKPVETQKVKVDDSPKAEDLNEDGTEKYPLGEFDPAFIRDLTRYTIRKEQEAEAIRQEETRNARKAQAEEMALQEQWTEKLTEAVKEKPDFTTKAQVLETTFRDLDPSYGEYLAKTIMSMEAGPEVLYYLASNIEEAQEIADLGAVKATIALGHLEAALTTKTETETQQKKTVKVSNAPEPPSTLAKGTKGHTDISADTDDLDDFARVFYSNRKR